jgi:hypothetical protein
MDGKTSRGSKSAILRVPTPTTFRNFDGSNLR